MNNHSYLIAALALCATGCASSGLPMYETPEACAEAFVRAELSRDWDAYVACWTAYARDAVREDYRRAAEYMREHPGDSPREEPDRYREVVMGTDHGLARDGIAIARVRLRHPRESEFALDPESVRTISLVWEEGSWRRTATTDAHRDLYHELEARYPQATDYYWPSWRRRSEPEWAFT
jgi:hypothetical protein